MTSLKIIQFSQKGSLHKQSKIGPRIRAQDAGPRCGALGITNDDLILQLLNKRVIHVYLVLQSGLR